MKPLKDNEIKFIKETGWTPTVEQMDYEELVNTPYYNLSAEEARNKYKELACQYGVSIPDLYENTCNERNYDGISLEYEATYLFYTFFTAEELQDMDNAWAYQWLQDFKYYGGYRKWDEHFIENEIEEALEIYGGSREFYTTDDGDVWNRRKEN